MRNKLTFTKPSRVARNYILDGEGGRRPEGEQEAISEDCRSRGIEDAKMHRGIEEWLFTEEQRTGGQEGKLFKAIEQRSVIADEVPQSEKIAQQRICLFTDTVLSPNRPIALSPSIRKVAFTLAETLITLAIIGVVAAMTLPTVVQNYQKQVVVNKLKKSYSNLQNALQRSVSENGDMSTWDFPNDQIVFFDKYIAPYYKNIANKKWYRSSTYTIDGALINLDTKWIILPDGTSVCISAKVNNMYYWMFIDINAKKGPNRLGKDVFMLYLFPKDNKLKFHSQGQENWQLKSDYDGGGYQCQKGTNARFAGGKCGAKIMQDGWKIKNDYPW